MTDDQMIQLAYGEGFAAAAVTDTDKIVFDPAFRPYCAENLCGQYGVNHSCPPDCGTPEEMKARVQEMRARVVEAEAEVPIALAEALRNGNLGVMDYYNMLNVQADTTMRDHIATATSPNVEKE